MNSLAVARRLEIAPKRLVGAHGAAVGVPVEAWRLSFEGDVSGGFELFDGYEMGFCVNDQSHNDMKSNRGGSLREW